MKKVQVLLSITLASTIIISTPFLGEAGINNGRGNYGNQSNNDKYEDNINNDKYEKQDVESYNKDEEKTDKADKKAKEKAEEAREKAEHNAYRDAKKLYNSEKSVLKEKEIELKKQIKAAQISGDQAKIMEIKSQIKLFGQQRQEIQKQMKENIIMIKNNIKNKYNNEELKKIEQVGNELQGNYKDIKAISVENIYAKGKDIKFDTPPVIKNNRTLIPIRALTEGFGYKVEWNQEDKKATIIKDTNVIELQLNNKQAIVNGKNVELDVPPSSYGRRTYVPLRFIIENLGLNIEHDAESGLIEIGEEQQI